MSYNWKWFRAGRMSQVSLTCGADIAALAELDRKQWIAISIWTPTTTGASARRRSSRQ